MKKEPKGEIFIFLAALCWSLSGVLTKSLAINPILSNSLRSIIAIVMMIVYNKFKLKVNKTIVIAGICLSSTNLLFFISLSLTTAANSIVIQYMAPIFVLLMTCVKYKKLPSPVQVLVVVIAFLGIVIIFYDSIGGGYFVGNVLALLSGVAFAGVFFVNRLKDSSPIDSTIIGFFINSVCGVAVFNQISYIEPAGWIYILLLGVIQLGLAYIFFSIGIKNCSSFSSSLISMTEVVLMPLWVLIFLGEVPKPLAIVGGILIVGAVITNIYYEKKSSVSLS